MTQVVKAKLLKAGDWIISSNPRFNERVVDVEYTRDGELRVYTDYGNGGEPATSFYEKDRLVLIDRNYHGN